MPAEETNLHLATDAHKGKAACMVSVVPAGDKVPQQQILKIFGNANFEKKKTKMNFGVEHFTKNWKGAWILRFKSGSPQKY